MTLGAAGKLTPDQARSQAKTILANVALGNDPVGIRSVTCATPTLAEFAETFLKIRIASVIIRSANPYF
jgi:hypothetical protein